MLNYNNTKDYYQLRFTMYTIHQIILYYIVFRYFYICIILHHLFPKQRMHTCALFELIISCTFMLVNTFLQNLSLRAYQYYERGQREPTASVLIALADYFDVSIDYLVGRTDNPKLYK